MVGTAGSEAAGRAKVWVGVLWLWLRERFKGGRLFVRFHIVYFLCYLLFICAGTKIVGKSA